MIHIDENNAFKEEWKSLLTSFSTIIEWSLPSDRYHLQLFFPDIDMNLFPSVAIRLFSALVKLCDYGGIVIIGENTKPPNSILSLLTIPLDKFGYFPRSMTSGKSDDIYYGNNKLEPPDVIFSPMGNETCFKIMTEMKNDLTQGIWRYDSLLNSSSLDGRRRW